MPMNTTAIAKRVHNFGAGPAVMPLTVLERVRAELVDYGGTGMSVLEMSHRSPAFEAIIQKAEAELRGLVGLGPDHAVLFLQGGASLQFAMVAANLRPAGASADYLISGHWSQAALKEAQKSGRVRVAASTEASGFDRVPAQAELDLDPAAAYLHLTSNNTIHGTQWPQLPEPPPGVPLVCDASILAAKISSAKALLKQLETIDGGGEASKTAQIESIKSLLAQAENTKDAEKSLAITNQAYFTLKIVLKDVGAEKN